MIETEEKKQGGQADDWFQTYSGVEFSLPEFRAENINIEDICHALSHQCRFNGHIRYFYSVAQHSVLLSLLVSKEHALWGLLHDTSKAYLGDMVGPLKRAMRVMPTYRKFEMTLRAEICKTFGLPLETPGAVNRANWSLLATEKRDLASSPELRSWDSIKGVAPLPMVIEPWDSVRAERAFLERYKEITDKQ